MVTDIEKALEAALKQYTLKHKVDSKGAERIARSINQLAQARYWLIRGNMETHK